MYFWASKSLSTRDKSLHGRWLQSLKGRCIITQELDVQILGNGEAVYRDSEKGKDISLAISGEPDKNACDEQTSSKMVQESFQDLSVADYNSQTPTKMVESVTRKCFSDPSQKLKGGLKKHQRSFEQERSILATRQHLFVEREGHESQYAHKTSRYPESDIESLPSNPAKDREEIIEGQKELHRRLNLSQALKLVMEDSSDLEGTTEDSDRSNPDLGEEFILADEEFSDDSDDSGGGVGTFNTATDVDTHSDADSDMSVGEHPPVTLLNDEDDTDWIREWTHSLSNFPLKAPFTGPLASNFQLTLRQHPLLWIFIACSSRMT